MYLLLYTKFAVAYLVEGQVLHAIEDWVKFLILQERTLRLILLIKEGQIVGPEKT
jgi:hypothetical protein